MNTEWKDLYGIVEVAAALAAGMEIETKCVIRKYRARPRAHSPADRAELGLPEQLDPISKPAMKKVKSICWRQVGGSLTWTSDEPVFATLDWKRFPAGDIEVEGEA